MSGFNKSQIDLASIRSMIHKRNNNIQPLKAHGIDHGARAVSFDIDISALLEQHINLIKRSILMHRRPEKRCLALWGIGLSTFFEKQGNGLQRSIGSCPC